MLFLGHAATGYLATKALLEVTHSGLSTSQISSLTLWGAICAMLPDLDVIIPFIKLRTLKLNTKFSHRRFFTHTPVFYLILCTILYFIAWNTYLKYAVIIYFISAIIHFLGDSVEYGIMWLWPFSKKQFALRKIPDEDFFLKENPKNFYWKMFKDVYAKNYSFYMEIFFIILAIVVYFCS